MSTVALDAPNGTARPRVVVDAACGSEHMAVRGSAAQRSRNRTSPASGTTSVSPSAENQAMSTAAGSR